MSLGWNLEYRGYGFARCFCPNHDL